MQFGIEVAVVLLRVAAAVLTASSLMLGCARAATPVRPTAVARGAPPSTASRHGTRHPQSHRRARADAVPAGGPHACPASVRTAVVARVNAERRAAALRPLASDAGLGRAAQSRARAMASANRLSHAGWESAIRREADAPTIAENVAYNYASADAVVDAWLRSPGHRANLLGRSFRRIGVGCVVDARARLWWAQDFAD